MAFDTSGLFRHDQRDHLKLQADLCVRIVTVRFTDEHDYQFAATAVTHIQLRSEHDMAPAERVVIKMFVTRQQAMIFTTNPHTFESHLLFERYTTVLRVNYNVELSIPKLLPSTAS